MLLVMRSINLLASTKHLRWVMLVKQWKQEIKEQITRTLAEEKLDGTIVIGQVLIRNIVPADSVVASANELVKAKERIQD
jgi:hypothetical protein